MMYSWEKRGDNKKTKVSVLYIFKGVEQAYKKRRIVEHDQNGLQYVSSRSLFSKSGDRTFPAVQKPALNMCMMLRERERERERMVMYLSSCVLYILVEFVIIFRKQLHIRTYTATSLAVRCMRSPPSSTVDRFSCLLNPLVLCLRWEVTRVGCGLNCSWCG